MIKIAFAVAGFFSASCLFSQAQYTVHQFKKIQASNQFWAEGAHYGDFNHDGKMDVVCGPHWYAGPDFKTRYDYAPATRTSSRKKADGTEEKFPGYSGALSDKNEYSENFFAFGRDINKDGWDDILILGFPGADSSWFENPKGASGHWKRHLALDVTDNESPVLADLTGDGQPEIVCSSKGYYGYATPDGSDPTKPWTFHRISPNNNYHKFTHGLGLGDVNGDGRMDLLEKDGWWEQPGSLNGDPVWKQHKVTFGTGGAQMFAYDVDGDGLNDVITSLAAHGYGLAWFEQVRNGGEIRFKEHTFMNKEPKENKYGVAFSQLHAIDLIDMDGDGLKDIVTGKRFWAHGPTGDAEPNAPAVLYWFKLARGPDKSVDFIPYLIDNDSGVGTQVVAADVNGDGLPDIVVGNKKGTFVHLHSAVKANREEWEKAQPKPLKVAAAVPPKPGRAGIQPLDAAGRRLDLGFEDGTLKNWTAQGKAFEQQPIQGDRVAKRRNDMKSDHDGNYWIGTYEIHEDGAEGTLTSVPFKVSQPFGSFLIGGGPYANTRVELVQADSGKPFFKISGFDGAAFRKSNDATESLRPVVVDLKEQMGKEIFIRVVDNQGGHWGHINYDDFRFHEAQPQFANALDVKQLALESLPEPKVPPLDDVKFTSLSPQDAVKEMSLPAGFTAQLVAGEPDVQQPIAFALDDRGRLWVAEAYNYPSKAPAGQGKDRILIFEDTDGDGLFNKRTVFAERLNLVSGLEIGFGGVWVGAAPELLFIPDQNGDDKPDGEPEVVLDGWAYQDTHETLNTFTWGPDGWLYGCHGVFTHSNVGKPGTASQERTRINAGVWRYHPTKRAFEVFAEGSSNPWGIDFDAYGQCFIEACVIPHLFHVIQGARYQRQAGNHFNPYVYDDIKTIADHVHYAGEKGPHAGNNRSGAAGGGHAHAGLLIYQGASWPQDYLGKIFMNNIHGYRINMDIPVRSGSGFVGKHGADLINFNDKSSQVINLLADQNGSVYMIDWYDQNQCHHGRADGHDRSNGRIFKIVYKNQPWTPVDLKKESDAALVQMQLHVNEWHVRHARRILQERGPNPTVHAALMKIATSDQPDSKRLRALWALHATGGLTEEAGLGFLKDQGEYMRAWTIQLLLENPAAGEPVLQNMTRLAQEDPSPVVRLYLASALQRIPVPQRGPILNGLLAHAEDAQDHNLPLMYWYAAEPVAGANAAQAAALLGKSKIPRLREFIAKRMASSPQKTAAVTQP